MKANFLSRERPKGYYFLTPVWGESYTRLFMDMSIPSQLSPENLPLFKDSTNSRYVIFTTLKDEEIIRNAPIFKRLSEVITVTIEYINDKITIPHDLMSDCHKRGIVMADDADCAALFLNPDLIFADGSFKKVRQLAEQGTDVILTTGIRTIKQGVVHELQSQFTAENTLVMQPRALMQIALNHLHPLADSSWWEEGDCDLIPANLYWRVGREGIVARCFHLHPLMVYPQFKGAVFFGTVDDDYVAAACPNAKYDYVVTDSDELLAIELSDPSRAFLTGFHKGSIDDTVTWAEQFTNSRHRKFFDSIIKMHVGIGNKKAWEEAVGKSDTVVKTVKERMKISAWKLLFTGSPVLQRRLIRWSQDRELLRANNALLKPIPLSVQQETFSRLVNAKKLAKEKELCKLPTLPVKIVIPSLKMSLPKIPYPAKISLPVKMLRPTKILFPVKILETVKKLLDSLGYAQKCLIRFLFGYPPQLFAAFLGMIMSAIVISFQSYIKLVRRIANFLAVAKIRIYGRSWFPYPWVWRYRYIVNLRNDMCNVLAGYDEKVLVLSYDFVQSFSAYHLGEKADLGMFVNYAGNSQIIYRDSSQLVADEHYQTVIVERALFHPRKLDSTIREIARVLKPGGKLILLVNRMSSPSDRVENEICMTNSTIASMLSPEFKILSQHKQCAFAQGLLCYVLDWAKMQSTRMRLPFVFRVAIALLVLPFNIIFSLITNLIIAVLDKLDTTGRCYVSSITTATKSEDI